jgi:hypothetical protein
MTAEELREVMERFLPDEVLMRAVEAAKFQQRDRRRDALRFLRAMLASASSPSGGRQADVMRTYFENQGPHVVRGAFYDWFGPPLEAVMKELREVALAAARDLTPDLPGVLGVVKDWRIVDATTVKLHPALRNVYPGAGDYAAVKVHKTLSVGRGCTIDYHFSPAREHDSPHLVIDESWRDFGLLADLAYASLARLRDCERFGVRYVIRLKDNWKPRVLEVKRGDVNRTFAPGTDLQMLLADDTLPLLGAAIDAVVELGSGPEAVRARLVGVHSAKSGYCFYLTNLPAKVGPNQVASLYRVRWEIETNNKLDKSSHRLDQIGARRPDAVNALLHASIIASILVGALVNIHHRDEARAGGDERVRPPLHHGLLARMLATCAFSIAEALDLEGPEADAKWQHLAKVLVFMGEDPNWRRKPSILDQLRGWKPRPAKKRASPPKAKKPAKRRATRSN